MVGTTHSQGCQSMQAAETLQKNHDLAQLLDDLTRNSIYELRQKWADLFSASPPAAFGPDLLRRSIAQRLQEDAFGKLSQVAQRELARLIRTMERAPNGRIELPRRIKPGSVLVRDWKGKSHRVSVLDQGFDYDGATYTSLSEIARQITGTRWNGPRFFGLRSANP
jgi:hypothetical protein